jgi:mannose-6-phosphate isomerase-like protein (cupin superfamily)
VYRYAPGRSAARNLDHGTQELLYVVSGRGELIVGSESHPLEPDMGAYVVSGESLAVDNPGPDELVIVAVSAPQEDRTSRPLRRTVRYADQPPLPAGADREFRYLVDQDAGCLDVTQFVGVIPPGRAPTHSHSYDEIVYVIDGEGILHLGDEERVIGPGSAMHLPPLAEHCLENTGKGSMRVLGVFHPSGDPASRAYDASR